MSLRAHLSTILLVGLAAGVGVYTWAVDRDGASVAERQGRARNVLPTWRRDAPVRLTREHEGERLVLETVADAGVFRFRMTSPAVALADPAATDKLLAALEFASVIRPVDDGAPGLGLEAPRARVVLEMGGATYRMVLGAKAPTPEGAAYLRVEGRGTFVVSKDLVAELTRPAQAFRERALVAVPEGLVARVTVRGPDGELTLTRADDLTFRREPGAVRAGRDATDALLAALTGLRATRFLDDAASAGAPFAGAPPVNVVLTPKGDGAPYELSLGGTCPGEPAEIAVRVVRPSPATACAARPVLGALDVPADTRLLAAHADEIEELRVEALPAGEALDLARKGRGFRERAPESRDLEGREADAAAAWVAALAAAEGRLFEEAAGPAPPPRARLTVVRAESRAEEIVEVFAGPKGPWALRRADGARLALDEATARLLAPGALADASAPRPPPRPDAPPGLPPPAPVP